MKGVYIWGEKNRIPTYVLLTNIILGKLKFNYMIYGYMIFELRALLVSKIFHIECHVKPTVVALIFLILVDSLKNTVQFVVKVPINTKS